MFSDNRFLGFLIAISLPYGAYQVVKNFRGLPGATTVIEASKDLADFANPFFKSDSELGKELVGKNRFHIQQTANRFAVANNAPGEFSFKADDKTKKLAVAKKETDKDKKKKKKKKKETEKKSQVASRPFYTQEIERPEPQQTENVYGNGATYTPAAVQVQADPDPIENAEAAYQKWAALLQNNPTFRTVTEFIAAFQNQQIPSEAYYRLVGELLAQNNSQFVEWGLLASTAVPGYESFTFLQAYIDSQNGTPVQDVAQRQLVNVYRKVEQLNVLRMVLSNRSSDSALIQAATFVEFLARVPTTPANEIAEDGTTRAVAATPDFSVFVPILESLKQHPDADVAQAADRALQAVLAVVPVQVAPAPGA